MEEKREDKLNENRDENLTLNKRRWKDSGEFKIGLTIFIAGALLILFYQMVAHYSGFKNGLTSLIRIISPFIYGFVMAYLLSPVYNLIIKRLYPLLSKREKIKSKTALTISRVIASVVSILLLVGVVGGMVALVVPQLFESVSRISDTLPSAFNRFVAWVEKYTTNMGNQDLAAQIEEAVESLRKNVMTWVQDIILPGVGTLVQRVSTSVLLTLRRMLNMVLGLVACVYFLNGKERFKAQIHKMVLALANPKMSKELDDFVEYSNKTFGGFINGKVIDSLIIGVICFIAMTIFGWPYPILISTIIAVTNIIPFFGPFIGAVPSALIIATVSPWTAFWFLVMIVILQQLDGNVIGPAILGQSTGLSSFWVMFSIVVFGGLFGFPGMLLGVPVFAVIYYYLGRDINRKLEKKGRPYTTFEYEDYDKYAINKEELRIAEEKTGETAKETEAAVKTEAEEEPVKAEEETVKAEEAEEAVKKVTAATKEEQRGTMGNDDY
ncbi:MAG: AI-2E family transporter [Firmicutes bacterium]|nr:AI-2E family transporter [Bacillota bacterium]